MKGLMQFEKKGKLASRYIEPFEILDRVGGVSYGLALPTHMSQVHPTFHQSRGVYLGDRASDDGSVPITLLATR